MLVVTVTVSVPAPMLMVQNHQVLASSVAGPDTLHSCVFFDRADDGRNRPIAVARVDRDEQEPADTNRGWKHQLVCRAGPADASGVRVSVEKNNRHLVT